MDTDTDRSQMLDALESFPGRLERLIDRLDDVRAAQRPADEEWSAAEVVAHLDDVNTLYAERIGRMLAEERPVFADFDQEAAVEERRGQTTSLAILLDRFARSRAELVATLRGIGGEGWDRTGLHPARGVVSVDEHVRILYNHDRAHAEQIRAAGGLPL